MSAARTRRPRSVGSPPSLTHVTADGEARMVDVGAKPDTHRAARASGAIRMGEATLRAVLAHTIQKGDVITVARLAGIMAAKRTADLVPLCHPVALTNIEVSVVPDPALPGLRAEAVAETVGKTGVEMEAMTAVAVTLITVYDMVKGLDRSLTISDVRLEEKRGGRSGHWQRR
jgi:cyclic pyranopterin phosphate synthase